MGVQIPFSFLKSLDFKPLQTKVRVLPWHTKSTRKLIFYLYLHNNLQHFASFCTSLHVASKPLHSHIFLECGKMRQISASKRSQNVVKIAKTDYCGFGQVFSFILSHPSISRHRERPYWHGSQQVC